MKKLLFAAVIAAFLLCGCVENSSELPEDTPYNHGRGAIMETEKGYYTNTATPEGGHMLRFYERDTENQIFLCAKPECTHDGNEGCAATYKNLECINTLLYDGAIYTLAVENGDIISFSLYRAALDGTSFTKVGDAFSVSNSAGESYEYMGTYFMIHKGYAYIPYHLTLGEGTFGFAGSGLVKMDIKTGKTEQLCSGEDYFSPYPISTLFGVGDNVYYLLSGYKSNDPDNGMYRYNIKTGETVKLSDSTYNNDLNFSYGFMMVPGNNYFYACGQREDKTWAIMSLDINSNDLSSGWTELCGDLEYCPELIAYKDRIIAISDKDKIIANSDLESSILILGETGGEKGKIFYDANEISGFSGDLTNEFYISDDKLYMSVSAFIGSDENYDRKIYSIPIADIEAGKSDWKFEYGIKNPWQLYKEMGGN